jgi:hypothetical protein
MLQYEHVAIEHLEKCEAAFRPPPSVPYHHVGAERSSSHTALSCGGLGRGMMPTYPNSVSVGFVHTVQYMGVVGTHAWRPAAYRNHKS